MRGSDHHDEMRLSSSSSESEVEPGNIVDTVAEEAEENSANAKQGSTEEHQKRGVTSRSEEKPKRRDHPSRDRKREGETSSSTGKDHGDRKKRREDSEKDRRAHKQRKKRKALTYFKLDIQPYQAITPKIVSKLINHFKDVCRASR